MFNGNFFVKTRFELTSDELHSKDVKFNYKETV